MAIQLCNSGLLGGQGDMQALIDCAQELERLSDVAESDADRIYRSLLCAQRPPDALREEILSAARSSVELGSGMLAKLFARIAGGEDWTKESARKHTVEIRSDKRRRYTVIRLHRHLKIAQLGVPIRTGYLPDSFELELNEDYLVIVHTLRHEPSVQIPISSSPYNTDTHVSVALQEWSGVDESFSWIPRTRSTIGGDLGARDPLPSMCLEVGPFCVGRKQVSMDQYLKYLEKIGETRPKFSTFPSYMGQPLLDLVKGKWQNRGISISDDADFLSIPVVGIDYDCAKKFCEVYNPPSGLVCDLLHEDEWEAVGRGADFRIFPWGDSFVPGFSNVNDGSGVRPPGLEATGCRRTDQSAFGLYDMSGNAEEWCGAPTFETTSEERFAVARGGSWYNPMQPSRLASRVVRHADYRHKKLSFRIVLRIAH